MKTSTCSCGRAATETVTMPIRIMAEHRTEMRKINVCPKCAESFREGPDRGADTGHLDTHEVVVPSAEQTDASALRRTLAYWNKETARWATKRQALNPGSSRAKVTTANARWMSACEVRDRVAQRLFDLTGEVL